MEATALPDGPRNRVSLALEHLVKPTRCWSWVSPLWSGDLERCRPSFRCNSNSEPPPKFDDSGDSDAISGISFSVLGKAQIQLDEAQIQLDYAQVALHHLPGSVRIMQSVFSPAARPPTARLSAGF